MDMPHKDPEAARAYYRKFKRTAGKRESDKYYTAARNANRRAERYGVEGKITTADARLVLSPGRCHYCATTEGWIGIDHVVPLAKGGPNHPSNMVPACHSCNVRKRRGDSVDKWSDEHEACVTCGLTTFKHSAHGRCRSCWPKEYALLRKQRSNSK